MGAALDRRLLRLAMDRQKSRMTAPAAPAQYGRDDVWQGLRRFDEDVFHRLFLSRFGQEL